MTAIPRQPWIKALLAIFLFCTGAHAEKVAITFDDLPLNGELAPGTSRLSIAQDVLGILKSHRVPQVYGFVNAGKLEGNRDGVQALQAWVAAGERVGNHSYSHMDLHTQTAERFIADVRADEPVLQLLDASDNWKWFRYPYLREGDDVEKRRAVRAQLNALGYRTAQVTLDYEDYLWNTAYAHCAIANDEKSIARLRVSYLDMASRYIDLDRAMAKLVFGRDIDHVLLLHLGAFSRSILPDLLDLLHTKGFTLATLEEVERDQAYASDPDAGSKYGGTLLEQWMDARHLQYPDVPKKPYKELQSICR